MNKRMSVSDLLDHPVVGEMLRLSEIPLDKKMSDITVKTLAALAEYVHENKQRPSYKDLKEVAANTGISNNLSSTTIKQAFDIYNASVDAKSGVTHVSVIHYAIKNYLVPKIKINGDNDLTDYNSVKRFMVILVLPLLALERQFTEAPDTTKKLVKLTSTMHKTTPSIAELFCTLLVDDDAQFNNATMQFISQNKVGRSLSYSSINKIKEAYEWVQSYYRTDKNEFHALAETVGTLTTAFSLMGGLDKDSFSNSVTDTILSVYRGAIKADSDIGKKLITFT